MVHRRDLGLSQDLGCQPRKVEDLTGYPSILGGRVKTLHPKVFGGILHRNHQIEDLNELAGFEIPPIDLVIVDLYPFEDTLKSGASHEALIEKIDIGGVSLIRAAAKNHLQCTILSSSYQYDRLLKQIQAGGTSLEDRTLYAAEAFAMTSRYDTLIFEYFNQKSRTDPLFLFMLYELPRIKPMFCDMERIHTNRGIFMVRCTNISVLYPVKH